MCEKGISNVVLILINTATMPWRCSHPAPMNHTRFMKSGVSRMLELDIEHPLTLRYFGVKFVQMDLGSGCVDVSADFDEGQIWDFFHLLLNVKKKYSNICTIWLNCFHIFIY